MKRGDERKNKNEQRGCDCYIIRKVKANNDKKVPCESMPYLSVQFHLVNDLYKKINDGNVALNSVKKKLFFFYDL
jgi:hypothetical protein